MPAGRPFEVQAEGAVITLTLTGQPGVSFSATVNGRGEFHLPDSPGNYIASYLWNGVAGTFPFRMNLGLTDVQSTVLNFLAGALPPSPATTLLGTVTLPGGLPARVNAPPFGLSAQATLHATFGDGSSRTVNPDAHGAFALTEIAGGFPVILTAVYQGLTAVTTIAAPPAALSVDHLQFS